MTDNILENEYFGLNPPVEFETAVFGFVNQDARNYILGANKRFYSELGYQQGLQELFAVPYHPVVSSSFLKLTQEIETADPKIIPAESINRILAQTHARYIEDKFADLEVDQYFSDLLLAYITGFIAHEFIWKKDRAGKGTIAKIQAIPVDYMLTDSSGVYFRESITSRVRVPEQKYKFSKFTYSQFLDISPLGDGVGKTIFYLLRERNKIECLADTFALRGATPTVVLKASGNVKASAVKSVITELSRTDSWKAIALPPGLDLSNLANSGSYEIYRYLLSSIDTTIAQLLAGETIVGSASGNSQRGSTEATALRRTRAARLAQKALSHINKAVVRPLIDVKFGPQTKYPQFVYPVPHNKNENRASITEAIQLQTQLGLEITPDWFEKEFGIDLKNVLADN